MSGIMMHNMSHKSGGGAGPTFDFSAPPQLVSASFDGTTQSLKSTSAVFTFTGDFTIEGWFRPTNVTGTHFLFTLGGASAGKYTVFLVGTSVTTNVLSSSNVTYTSTVSINVWSHIAVVRSGSTVSVYINGVASATTDTQAGTLGNGSLTIGADQPAASRFAGQISNVRVAASAVYPGNFTTPTRPLSPTGSVFFAALGVTAFVDSSSNAISITNTGTVILADPSPFPATWTDSVSGIVATVAGAAQFGNNNPTYDPRYGGGLMFGESPRQTYVDVPTAYTRPSGGAFTISIAAQIPGSPQNHYNAIFCSNTVSRSGNGIMSRYWQGDGLEFGHTSNWLTGGFLTMNQLAWYDYVYSANGTTVALYKNGALVTSGSVSGAVTGWLNPLRFGGDESITGVNANTMATGVMYRMKCQPEALSAAQVTAQFAAVRATYGL